MHLFDGGNPQGVCPNPMYHEQEQVKESPQNHHLLG